MYLPRQRLFRERPWLIAGIVLVIMILLIAVYGYFSHKGETALPGQRKKTKSAGSTMAILKYRECMPVVLFCRSLP